MRILLVSASRKNPDAGASRVYHLLEQGLTARGHAVTLLHYEDLGLSGPAEKTLSRLVLPQFISRSVARFGAADFDVIMTSAGMLYPYFKRLSAMAKRPLLVNHSHGSTFFNQLVLTNEWMRGHVQLSPIYRHVTGPLLVHWERQGLKYADVSIVQNNRDLDLFTDGNNASVVNIPLTVHPDLLEAGFTSPAPETRDPLALLWFGSWSERKGTHYLPRAFKGIVARQPNATLTLWGTGLGAEEVKSHFDPELRSRLTVRALHLAAGAGCRIPEVLHLLIPFAGGGFSLDLD